MNDAVAFVLIAAGLFALIGVVTAIVMGRRGNDPWMWGAVGTVLGPFVVLLVLVRRRDSERPAETVLQAGSTATGSAAIRVLVGVDGSVESLAATSAVGRLLGDRVRSMTLATVLDLDAIDAICLQPNDQTVFERDARILLDEAAARVEGVKPSTVILGGRPTAALAACARRHEIDLLVIGARGDGLSEAVLGSVAEDLLREPDMLVLVAGRAATIPQSASVN